MARDLHGPFPARVSFLPIDGPFVLGLLFGPRLLPARCWPVPLMGQFRPMARVILLLACSLMGQIRPMARVGLFLACYPNGPNSAHGKSRPVSGLLTRCAVSSPSYILAH